MEASALSPLAGLQRRAIAAPLLRLRTDEQLVALFRAGDENAFQVIYDRYRQRIFAYTRRMLPGSRSDAEDALQDVFLRAYGALRDNDRPIALRPWLYRVAHNRCIDQLRRPHPELEAVFHASRAPLRDPVTESERRTHLNQLIADMGLLPKQQRSALLMRELEGLSYSELAAALDVTIPAVKSLLVRARMGLVEAIEAREAACTDIRDELSLAHGRGVRISGRSRRHMRECRDCRDYRGALQGLHKGFAALNAPGPLATLFELIGCGGTSLAALGGGTSATVGTGAAAATKVAAMVCCAAVVTGTAGEARKASRSKTPTPVAAAPRPAPQIAQTHSAPKRAHVDAAAPAPAIIDDGTPREPTIEDQDAVEPATATGGMVAPPAAEQESEPAPTSDQTEPAEPVVVETVSTP